MSTVTPTQPLVSLPATLAPLTPRRITVDEFERIIASGSLNEPKKVELIDGYMVTKMSKSPEHGFSTKELLKGLDRLLEVYTDPGPAGYASRTDFPSGQQVPVVIDGRHAGQIAVDDILP